MTLYEADRHEPLHGAAWDEGLARGAMAQIIADTQDAFTPDGLWPIHPLDRSPERPPDCLKPLYHGAAGVIWALDYLAGAGVTSMARDYRPAARGLVERNRQDLGRHAGVAEYMGHDQAAWLVGETGLLLLLLKLDPRAVDDQQLHAAIGSTVGDPRGLVWGGAGGMLAALFLHERTGAPLWRDLFIAHFDALWERWTFDDASGCWLWIQDLYGSSQVRLGALHGFLANALPIVRGARLLQPIRAEAALDRISETVRALAVRRDGLANWPNSLESQSFLVQHCSGAPGVINTLAEWPPADEAMAALLLEAGELVWRAGPPVKPPSLCHGAPGSGYAFLKLHARTGDERWLARARAFAMHAIEQSRLAAVRHGQRKYSVWTGDLGLAIYLWDCVRGIGRFPMLDVF